MTPYRLHTLVNREYSRLGWDKKMPPQMMYNYVRTGMIPATKDPETGKWNIDDQVAQAWLAKFVVRAIDRHEQNS